MDKIREQEDINLTKGDKISVIVLVIALVTGIISGILFL
jgi:hypothetical protein